MAVEFKSSMSKNELLEIAAEHGIEADDSMKKNDILKLLEQARAAEGAQEPQDGTETPPEGNDPSEGDEATQEPQDGAETPPEGNDPAAGDEATQEPQDGEESTTGDSDTEPPAEDAQEAAPEGYGLFVYTFTKNETEIELTLATPLTADDMVTKGIMSVVRQIPAGAKFTVEVCNNGNDASPTWEDVTQNVVSGSKFFLSNTTKTASAWGYNFRIKVKRGTATGDCFITSAGGNFE